MKLIKNGKRGKLLQCSQICKVLFTGTNTYYILFRGGFSLVTLQALNC